MEKLITALNLTKTFGDAIAVDNLTLQVRAGEIYGLVGPDGAGKTTTIRLLCGALRPDQGEVTVGGYSMNADPDRGREQLGYLSQKFSLYEELTVMENIRFFAEVRGISPRKWKDRAMEILDFVGLVEFIDRRAGFLSGGMKQKLGLATALVHRPRVLLLDEHTGGVDPVTRQDFWQLIIRLVGEEHISVLVSTPYMDEAVRCTYVGFMREGRLIVEDKPTALRQRLEGRILELRGSPLKTIRTLAAVDEDVQGVQVFGDKLHIRLRSQDHSSIIPRLRQTVSANQAVLDKIEAVHPSLEDVFIALIEADMPSSRRQADEQDDRG